MSDDLMKRLRAMGNPPPLDDQDAVMSYVLYAEEDAIAAVNRIEQLEAERDTLAEIVRLLNVSVEPYAEGETVWWLTVLAVATALTPDQAERFASVLDHITKEASDE